VVEEGEAQVIAGCDAMRCGPVSVAVWASSMVSGHRLASSLPLRLSQTPSLGLVMPARCGLGRDPQRDHDINLTHTLLEHPRRMYPPLPQRPQSSRSASVCGMATGPARTTLAIPGHEPTDLPTQKQPRERLTQLPKDL
jgi:hypothetical protein